MTRHSPLSLLEFEALTQAASKISKDYGGTLESVVTSLFEALREGETCPKSVLDAVISTLTKENR
ncbi:hypothetical protein EN828_09405 [Mesorhizobium sp. M2D.F.Ca.ET.185.01.1.1]|uniref:hypothetical protein n=1 Tax=unclassified Mesorhizobium TaxID=325217 RepID=UPI000FCC5D86|nr:MULTISPECIES: hypothetical protein [unclassified Mesorhizobium]TGP82794.1 hypothetical protein EN870_06000 [bacterium M00.F.Ca.ET.227.01.1.1]TGP94537.1 hypothetical protein EN864_13920 [bacterium M00.F.Ca.ET.221.01.1.1]TGP97990.1 hypothetical protein EN865_10145 [bacterium M00.F.Ca.ET.222.01.1.1]TGU02095.1 hypothetical protein EN806_45285 [bacterium M00.F.Ca.ET.163.01.1.1]TGU19524.1 hypothetical protein EN799_57770 [bacterium M00.F.Ca.ET.156.01.1.1]TGU48972.1 hypothetical protein EN789_093